MMMNDDELERELAKLTAWNGADAKLWRGAFDRTAVKAERNPRSRVRFIVAATAGIAAVLVIASIVAPALNSARERASEAAHGGGASPWSNDKLYPSESASPRYRQADLSV